MIMNMMNNSTSNMNITMSLTSMGYRAMNMKEKKVWMKPIAFATIGVVNEENKLKFAIYFKASDSTPSIWSRKEIDLTEFDENPSLSLVETIKYAEQDLFSDFSPYATTPGSKFEFITPLEQANMLSNLL